MVGRRVCGVTDENRWIIVLLTCGTGSISKRLHQPFSGITALIGQRRRRRHIDACPIYVIGGQARASRELDVHRAGHLVNSWRAPRS